MTRMWFRISFIGCLFPVIGCAADDSCGFRLSKDKARVTWGTNVPVNFYVTDKILGDVEQMNILNLAAQSWNIAAGRTVITIRNVSTNLSIKKDGYNVLGWYGPQPKETRYAYTQTYFSGSRLTEGDINFSTLYTHNFTIKSPTSTEIDFFSLALHEMGHALGLLHSNEKLSPMWPYLLVGEQKRTLTPQDISNVKCGYGTR